MPFLPDLIPYLTNICQYNQHYRFHSIASSDLHKKTNDCGLSYIVRLLKMHGDALTKGLP
jgi:hypothetical protein